MSMPSGGTRPVYIDISGRVEEFLQTHWPEFRSGRVLVAGVSVPFDAEWMSRKLGLGRSLVVGTLRDMAMNPTNYIALCWKTEDNPDVIHIDSVVLEFIRSNEFDVIMETGGFDAQYISDQLGLCRNFVACALRRLAADPKNFLGLINATSNNPAPVRDYGTPRDSAYAATVVG